MELSDYRAQIDRIDRQLVELFAQRMEHRRRNRRL